jgi:hypothetical protein
MSASFEYTLYQMGDSPSIESLSDMVVRLCMEDEDRSKEIIGNLVDALHGMRSIEAERTAEDDEDCTIPVVDDVEKEFRAAYKRTCQEDGTYCDDESGCWADHEWPINSPWHKDEVHRLARLQAGSDEVFRRQCRELMEASKK